MKTCILRTLFALALVARLKASPVTHYADANGTNPVSPYTSWATAATNIQNAVDVSATGDLILVTNGVYQSGSQNSFGANRVNISRLVTVQSVNGPAATTIVGKWDTATNGPNAIRCVCLVNGATLSGFTLTNGATAAGEYGGGVRCISTNAVVTNCVITGNSAYSLGGGSYYGTLENCIVSRNVVAPFSSTGSGGGAAYGTLINCLLTQNFVGYVGGAAAYCSLVNCTVVSNSAAAYGGSLLGVTLKNCIVYYNHSYYTNADDSDPSIVSNSCVSFFLSPPGANNFTNPPLFANLAGGDYHLGPASPCINAGNNSFITNVTDLNGNMRVIAGIVDMGAYEFQSPVRFVNISNSSPVSPFNSWTSAATNIQDAVDVANAGDFIVVGNGAYKSGGRAVYGAETNRVVLTNAVTLMSANGPNNTLIVGGVQMRCAYVGGNSLMSGFTLTNGQARTSGDVTNEESGGGAWCETGSVISNCVVIRNSCSSGNGGGVYGGVIWNSLIATNEASHGGGAAQTALFNCQVISNMAGASLNSGGGVYQGMLSNCTVIANWSYHAGAGIFQSTALSSVLSSNYSHQGNGGGAEQSILYNCTAIGNHPSGTALGTNYNCTLAGNAGGGQGGGMNGGIGYNCIISNNGASVYGGGAYQATLYNCVLTGNKVTNIFSSNGLGGGAYQGTLYNCTVVGNFATSSGGGIYDGSSFNSIFYYNSATTGSNWLNGAGVVNSMTACCTTPYNGGITNPPLFKDYAGGDFHLQTNSPCINAGNNAYVSTSTDLDGNPRISGGTVDMGAYEFQNPPSILSYAWAQQYGLPTDGSMDHTNLDGTGFDVYQDWVAGLDPTNPASVLAVSSAVSTNSASGITVTWQSVNDRTYYLQRGSDLMASFSTVQSNIVGQAVTTSYTDTSATNAAPYFYRVGVQ